MQCYANGTRLPAGSQPDADIPTVMMVPTEESKDAMQKLDIHVPSFHTVDESTVNRFESHTEYDCLLLNIPYKTDAGATAYHNVDIYYTATRIVIVYDKMEAIEKLIGLLEGAEGGKALPFDQTLYALINCLTEHDISALELMEEKIASLEDEIIEQAHNEQLEQISDLRKVLLRKKRYFESLLDALEDLEENQNRFLKDTQTRALRIVRDRVERQLHTVQNLRDYVTQVREAYQSQMDISLNKTMRLFTVLTAIFSPLTLLVGWYGMNLRMPEAESPHAYPIVIVASIVIVVVSIGFFRRKKWF